MYFREVLFYIILIFNLRKKRCNLYCKTKQTKNEGLMCYVFMFFTCQWFMNEKRLTEVKEICNNRFLFFFSINLYIILLKIARSF